MADAYINIFLNDDKIKQLQDTELAGQVKTVDGKQAVQVGMTAKDQKKLVKGYEGLTFDASNACVLPEKGEEILWKIILDMKSIDVMKFAITKLYNPLAGRDVFGRGSGGR
ncbi:MAG: hypothetical protein P1P89_02575 [Desulfobacterales bacterium]|nr:hypothetical protein [Desulfobacterales bacterium]